MLSHTLDPLSVILGCSQSLSLGDDEGEMGEHRMRNIAMREAIKYEQALWRCTALIMSPLIRIDNEQTTAMFYCLSLSRASFRLTRCQKT